MLVITQQQLLARAGELGFTNTHMMDGQVRAMVWRNMLIENSLPGQEGFNQSYLTAVGRLSDTVVGYVNKLEATGTAP